MVVLGSKTTNTLSSYQSNVGINKIDVKKQSMEEVQAYSSTGFAPTITTNVNA